MPSNGSLWGGDPQPGGPAMAPEVPEAASPGRVGRGRAIPHPLIPKMGNLRAQGPKCPNRASENNKVYQMSLKLPFPKASPTSPFFPFERSKKTNRISRALKSLIRPL